MTDIATAAGMPVVLRLDGYPDRRNQRSVETQRDILRAARTLLMHDRRWPRAVDIATAARVSVRTIYQQFDGGITEVMASALTDDDCGRIATRLRELADRDLVKVALTGRAALMSMFACPECGAAESDVKDSRPTDGATVIRRRRTCPVCGVRFTTYESAAASLGDSQAARRAIELGGRIEALSAFDRALVLALVNRLEGNAEAAYQQARDVINGQEARA